MTNRCATICSLGAWAALAWAVSPGLAAPNLVVIVAGDLGYFVLWDKAWVRVGGREVGTLNDGAYWWRFRTPPQTPSR